MSIRRQEKLTNGTIFGIFCDETWIDTVNASNTAQVTGYLNQKWIHDSFRKGPNGAQSMSRREIISSSQDIYVRYLTRKQNSNGPS